MLSYLGGSSASRYHPPFLFLLKTYYYGSTKEDSFISVKRRKQNENNLNKTKPNETKRNKTEQDKKKQNKTKQNKTALRSQEEEEVPRWTLQEI